MDRDWAAGPDPVLNMEAGHPSVEPAGWRNEHRGVIGRMQHCSRRAKTMGPAPKSEPRQCVGVAVNKDKLAVAIAEPDGGVAELEASPMILARSGS